MGESLDALRLPGVSDSFDAIMGSDLLTHLPNFDATFGTFLAEALRVLRPGGRLILLNRAIKIGPTMRKRWHNTSRQMGLRVFWAKHWTAVSWGAAKNRIRT